MQLLPVKRHDIAVQILWPFAALLQQPLLPHTKAGALSIQNPDLVAHLVDEDKQLA